MRYLCLFSTFALIATGCSTLNESMQFGAAAGGMVGAGATYAGYRGAGKSPSLSSLAIGAGIGVAAGTFASYLIHGKVAEDRELSEADQIEMHFGDLPPSPFLIPRKKGGKR